MVTVHGVIRIIQTKVRRKATNGMAYQMKMANKMNQIHGLVEAQINDTIDIVKDQATIEQQIINRRKIKKNSFCFCSSTHNNLKKKKNNFRFSKNPTNGYRGGGSGNYQPTTNKTT